MVIFTYLWDKDKHLRFVDNIFEQMLFIYLFLLQETSHALPTFLPSASDVAKVSSQDFSKALSVEWLNNSVQNVVPAVLYGIQNDDWVHYRNFGSWSYEGGNIVRGLWRIAHATNDSVLETFLHNHLNYFQQDPSEFGFRILHNESLTYNDSSIFFPWLYSIGDNIGLFPIAFGDRLRLSSSSSAFSAEDDRYILSEVVAKAGRGWPVYRSSYWSLVTSLQTLSHSDNNSNDKL